MQTSPPFIHGSIEHLAVIAIALITVVAIWKLEIPQNWRIYFERFLIAGLILGELVYFWQLSSVEASWKAYLPLHLSQIGTWTAIASLFLRSRFGHTLTFWFLCWSVPLSLIAPALTEGFPSLTFLRFFSGYILLVSYLAYLVWYQIVDPSYRAFLRSYGVLVLIVLLVYLINSIIGTNYIFLMEKPHPDSITWLPGHPWHIVVVGLLVFIGTHGIWALVLRSKNQKRSPKKTVMQKND